MWVATEAAMELSVQEGNRRFLVGSAGSPLPRGVLLTSTSHPYVAGTHRGGARRLEGVPQPADLRGEPPEVHGGLPQGTRSPGGARYRVLCTARKVGGGLRETPGDTQAPAALETG